MRRTDRNPSDAPNRCLRKREDPAPARGHTVSYRKLMQPAIFPLDPRSAHDYVWTETILPPRKR